MMYRSLRTGSGSVSTTMRIAKSCPMSGREDLNMKRNNILVAVGLVVAGLGISTAADAQQYGGGNYGHQDRDHRYGRHDNGRHNGWGNGRGHRRCWTEYRHHRQVRVCR
jgi:hypothetical protein